MKLCTHSPRLAELRRGVMGLYISAPPLDCLTCPSNGNCEFHTTVGVVGLREVCYRLEGDNHFDAALASQHDLLPERLR